MRILKPEKNLKFFQVIQSDPLYPHLFLKVRGKKKKLFFYFLVHFGTGTSSEKGKCCKCGHHFGKK